MNQLLDSGATVLEDSPSGLGGEDGWGCPCQRAVVSLSPIHMQNQGENNKNSLCLLSEKKEGRKEGGKTGEREGCSNVI